jgi:uncharacterized protein with HEPN domain
MPPEDLIRLRHMAEAARLAIGLCQGRQRADMGVDAVLRLAVLHAVQIVGEAAAKVTATGRTDAPTIDWPVIVGMRNRLVHAYFDIDADILWQTVMHGLPALLAQLQAVDGVVEAAPPKP